MAKKNVKTKDPDGAQGLLPQLVGYEIRRAQARMTADFQRIMGEFEITPGQFGVLTLISENPGISQSALARLVGVERSTMAAVIDRLTGRGLVERRAAVADQRSHALFLSAAGKAFHKKLIPLVEAHEARMTSDLTEAEKAHLLDLLRRITP